MEADCCTDIDGVGRDIAVAIRHGHDRIDLARKVDRLVVTVRVRLMQRQILRNRHFAGIVDRESEGHVIRASHTALDNAAIQEQVYRLAVGCGQARNQRHPRQRSTA